MVRAIELAPEENINYWIFLNGVISQLSMFEGRFSTGLQYHATEKTVAPQFLMPWRAVGYNNLGLAYEYLQNNRSAQVNFEKAVSIDPVLDLAWFNLAAIAVKLQEPERFSAALGRLQSINPALARSAERLADATGKRR